MALKAPRRAADARRMKTQPSRPILFVLAATGSSLCAGCGVTPSEADARPSAVATAPAAGSATAPVAGPQKTLARMLALAEAGDWGAYVDDHYGEAHKFRSPADRDALVQRFEGKWGPRILEALRRAAAVTPTVAEGRATFVQDGEPLFELHDHDGRWMFHL